MKVVVVGDITFECYYYGTIKRISPEAPVPVVHVEKVERKLSGAGKIVERMKGQGFDVSFFGVIGTDENGLAVCNLLREKNIDFTYAFISPRRVTTSRQYIVVDNHTILGIDFEEPFTINQEEKADVKGALLKQVQQGIDAICISSYGEGICTEAVYKWLRQVAEKENIAVIMDPEKIPLDKIL